jgi:hypothetical protein
VSPSAPATDEREALRRLRAYATKMRAETFFTHASSGVIWGIPLPRGLHDVVHVGCLHPSRAPRGRGVRGHEISPSMVSIRDHLGFRLASPASTWAQLGSVLSVRDLVAAGDAIVRIPRGPGGRPGEPNSALGSLDQLAAAAEAGRRTGASRLRTALPLIRLGSSSRPESHLRLVLDDAGLPSPVLDVEIRDEAGVLLGITEIAYPDRGVLVEYEGDHHRSDPAQWNRDIAKYERYRAAGFEVVRITSEHLYTRPAEAPLRVRDALRAAGWHEASVHPSRCAAPRGRS